jgi:fibronectin type 3 domain-containing protein
LSAVDSAGCRIRAQGVFEVGRLVVFAGVLATLVFSGSGTSATSGEPFFFGFSEDLPKEIGAAAVAPAAGLGASAFRLTTLWTPGQTALAADEAAKLDRATAAASGQRIVLAVFADAGAKAPQDAAARDAYCAYVHTVLSRYPSIRDVVIWNEPNKSLFWSPQLAADGTPIAAARYTELLARCYDVLHAAFPGVNVIGLGLSSTGNDNAGSASPGAFIRGVGDAYRASGRTAPLLDTVGYHPYGADAAERPWRKHIGSKTIAQGDWNKLMYNLFLAFDGTAQQIPGQGSVRLWYTEAGVQTAVDATKAVAYTGTENVKTVPDYAGGEPDAPIPAETSPAPDQWTQALDAIRLAACQPYVSAYFNFLLADEPRLAGWQSGPFWADLTPKASEPAFRQAIGEAVAGSVACDTLKGGRPSADFMPPSAPPSLTGAALTEPARVELVWAPAGDDTGVAAYRVYRNGAHVGTTAATTWTNTAVTSGATYTYVVRALDAAGSMGDASPPFTVTMPDIAAPSAPGVPTGQALASPQRIDLTWPAATDNVAVTAYEISRDGALLAIAAGNTYSDTSVGSAATYVYTVVALDAAGNRGPASAPVTVTSLDSVAPTTPASLAAAAAHGPDRVELTWAVSGDDLGVAGYEVLRSGVLLATVVSTGYVDTTAQQGVAYTYSVRAFDAAGNRGTAATVVAKVADVVAPSAPTSLTAAASNGPHRVRLTWSAASDNVAVTGYWVYRNGVLLASATAAWYTDYAVSRKTTYRYAVRALDAAGNLGASSATVYVTTR